MRATHGVGNATLHFFRQSSIQIGQHTVLDTRHLTTRVGTLL
jgi:hypothetical protein